MNLEYIEQRCLAYLKQCKNPLVPFDTLLSHCKQDPACAGISDKILMDFLAKHDEVRILEGPTEDAPIPQDTFAAAGLIMGTRVIHRDRIPTNREFAVLIREHIGSMLGKLDSALSSENSQTRKSELEALRRRVCEFQDKVKHLI